MLLPMRAVPVEALQRVLQGHLNVRWAYLFGSAARKDPRWQDLDVGVVGTEPWDLLPLARLAGDLQEAAGAKIDLVDLGAAPPVFTLDALRGAVVLVDRDRDARVDWEAERLSEAIDFLPDYERMLGAWRKRIRGARVER